MKRTSLCVAIADNHDLLREQTRSLLIHWGYEVIAEAHNGEELLEQLLNLTRLPDLFLLDADMPYLNGCDTARVLRERHPSVKILIFSLFAGQEEIRRLLTCGADAFLPKESSIDTWWSVITAYH